MSTVPTCVLPSFQWAFNSHGASPCSVAFSLFNVCGAYQVAPLQPNSHYLGPTIDGANPCMCNTVSYSMMAACAACQNGTITSWSEWSTNCATVFIDSYPKPIPEGTFVPGWAYLDVTASDSFNPNTAKQDANATESTAIPQPTTTTHSTTHSTPASTTISTSTSTSTPIVSGDSSTSTGDSVDSRANIIGSGVVGGLAGLAAVLLGIAYLYFRRRTKVPSAEAPEIKESSEKPATTDQEETQIPDLVVRPPSAPFYQNTEALSSDSCPEYMASGSEGSLVPKQEV